MDRNEDHDIYEYHVRWYDYDSVLSRHSDKEAAERAAQVQRLSGLFKVYVQRVLLVRE